MRASNVGQIELNIAGHVPGACRVCVEALFYCSGGHSVRGSRQSNPVAVWADGWSVSVRDPGPIEGEACK